MDHRETEKRERETSYISLHSSKLATTVAAGARSTTQISYMIGGNHLLPLKGYMSKLEAPPQSRDPNPDTLI